jgi:hypothetical protein
MILAAALMAFSASADLEELDRAMARCERTAVNPLFAAEAQRRSDFLTAALKEQEAIAAERLAVADRRRALRETAARSGVGDSEQQLNLIGLALEDRQRALNDRRTVESMRSEAMDAKRNFYLSHCAPSKDPK